MTQIFTGPLLIYDDDCSMCRSLVTLLVRMGILQEAALRTESQIAEPLRSSVHAAGLKNEIIAADEATGETRAGIDAFLWHAEASGFETLVKVARIPPLRRLLRILYRTISYNRRIIAPVRSTVQCACDPDYVSAYRWVFIAICFFSSTAVEAVCGVAILSGLSSTSSLTTGAAMVGGAVISFVLAWLASARLGNTAPSAEDRSNFMGHLSYGRMKAAVILVPGAVVSLFTCAYSHVAIAVLVAVAWFVELVRARRGATGQNDTNWRQTALWVGPAAIGALFSLAAWYMASNGFTFGVCRV